MFPSLVDAQLLLLFLVRSGRIVVVGVAPRLPLPLPDNLQPRLPTPGRVTPEYRGRPQEVLHGVGTRLIL